MGYHRLTREDRYQIQALLASGKALRQISRQLCRSPSTISRECNRGSLHGLYDASRADRRSVRLRYAPHPSQRVIKCKLRRYIRQRLLADWSPQQIAVRLKSKGKKYKVCYQTIYRFVQRERRDGGELWKHLRTLRRERKYKKQLKRGYTGGIPNRLSIEMRPDIVEERNRLGDYERDTLCGKRNDTVLLTIVDRTSRRLFLEKLDKYSSEKVHEATVKRLKNRPLHTITNDNGTEFASHADTAKALNVPIYFCGAMQASQRGTNENTNGLLRQYFPKKRRIGPVTDNYLRKIEARLNNRPRKVLGYRTPLEIERLYRSSGVALNG